MTFLNRLNPFPRIFSRGDAVTQRSESFTAKDADFRRGLNPQNRDHSCPQKAREPRVQNVSSFVTSCLRPVRRSAWTKVYVRQVFNAFYLRPSASIGGFNSSPFSAFPSVHQPISRLASISRYSAILLFSYLAIGLLTAFAQTNPAATSTRFLRGTGTDADYHSFVLPLGTQKGIALNHQPSTQ